MRTIKATTSFQTILGVCDHRITCWNTEIDNIKIAVLDSSKYTLYAVYEGTTFPYLDMELNVQNTISSFRKKLHDYLLHSAILVDGNEYYKNGLNNGFYLINNDYGTDITIYSKDEINNIMQGVIYGN